jgi:hypothetical protein
MIKNLAIITNFLLQQQQNDDVYSKQHDDIYIKMDIKFYFISLAMTNLSLQYAFLISHK